MGFYSYDHLGPTQFQDCTTSHIKDAIDFFLLERPVVSDSRACCGWYLSACGTCPAEQCHTRNIRGQSRLRVLGTIYEDLTIPLTNLLSIHDSGWTTSIGQNGCQWRVKIHWFLVLFEPLHSRPLWSYWSFWFINPWCRLNFQWNLKTSWIHYYTSCQWEFQDPKMEVLYHIKPYFGGIFPYIGLKHRPYIW